MRIVPPVLGLIILGCAAPGDWYSSPDEVAGKAYKNCTADVSCDGAPCAERVFNEKGYEERYTFLDDEGETSGVYQYTYDKDGKTLIRREYGPSASEVTQTESYEYEKGDLVHVEGQSDDSGRYTMDVTYGKGGRRDEIQYTGQDSNRTQAWSWSDGDDGGDAALVTVDDSDSIETYVWDSAKALISYTSESSDTTIEEDFTYSDDAAGLLESIVIREIFDGGTGAGTAEYTYDSDDRLSRYAFQLEALGYMFDYDQTYDWSCD